MHTHVPGVFWGGGGVSVILFRVGGLMVALGGTWMFWLGLVVLGLRTPELIH